MAEITLQEAVKKFTRDLAQKVNSFITDVSELEVRTFTTPADQVETFVKGKADFAEILTEGKVALRAYTKISFDGDTTVAAPTDPADQVNKSVWTIHETAVEQAMENRREMIKTIGEAAASALKALGVATGD
jgi:hypothetical protein